MGGFHLLRIIESEGYKDEQQEDIEDPEVKSEIPKFRTP